MKDTSQDEHWDCFYRQVKDGFFKNRRWLFDEFPALFIAAACAEGPTVLTGAAELRVKESDRIAVMADGLRTLGVQADPTPDVLLQAGNPQTLLTIDDAPVRWKLP